MLTTTQTHWNNNILNYDLEKYNWPAWVLSIIQEVAPNIKELETLHEVLSPAEIVGVSAHVQNACSRKDFMEMLFGCKILLMQNLLNIAKRQHTHSIKISNDEIENYQILITKKVLSNIDLIKLIMSFL